MRYRVYIRTGPRTVVHYSECDTIDELEATWQRLSALRYDTPGARLSLSFRGEVFRLYALDRRYPSGAHRLLIAGLTPCPDPSAVGGVTYLQTYRAPARVSSDRDPRNVLTGLPLFDYER